MKDGDRFQPLTSNAAGDDVRRLGDDQLPCAEQPAGPAHVGLSLKKVDRAKNPLGYDGRIPLGVSCDEIPKRDEML